MEDGHDNNYERITAPYSVSTPETITEPLSQTAGLAALTTSETRAKT